MSYMVAVFVTGESGKSYNTLRFAAEEEAQAYGRNLYSRWTLMTGFEIEKSNDPANYTFTPEEGLKEIQ